MSDHRPVSADFNLYVRLLSPQKKSAPFYNDIFRPSPLQVPVVDSAALDEHVHGLWKDVATIEQAESAPQLAVEPSFVEFGKIGSVVPSMTQSRAQRLKRTRRYMRPVRKVLKVRNTGKVGRISRWQLLSVRAHFFRSPQHSDSYP